MKLTKLLSPVAIELLEASGVKLVKQIGLDVIRGVVYDVMCGKNLRDSTEELTRRRIASLNLALLNFFIRAASASEKYVATLPSVARKRLSAGKLTKAERWLSQWLLGLTDKGYQNILRDDPKKLEQYESKYVRICEEVIAQQVKDTGQLSGSLTLASGEKARLNWLFVTYLLNTVGCQTLTIRGSEKSAYGKLFEGLILGSLLHILGFRHVSGPDARQLNKVFWLSSRGARRESDATLLYKPGKGIRFDIGFIGRGNPEISLDKVTRFAREVELGKSKYYMHTIIIVDRIGDRSKIEMLAKRVGGTILQMSMAYWPVEVARELYNVLGHKHELLRLKGTKVGSYLKAKIAEVPLEEFFGNVSH